MPAPKPPPYLSVLLPSPVQARVTDDVARRDADVYLGDNSWRYCLSMTQRGQPIGGAGARPTDTYQAAFTGGADERERARLDLQGAVYARLAAWTLDTLDIGPGRQVLEVGCGGGTLLAAAAARVGPTGRVVGIDRDPTVLAEARRRTAAYPWVEVVEGDANDLRAAGERFDVVHCRLVLMHQFDADAFLAAMMACARPGGRVGAQEYDVAPISVQPPLPDLDAAMPVAVAYYDSTGMDAHAGGKLPDRFHRAGLHDLRVEAQTPYFALTDPRAALLFAQFAPLGDRCEALGVTTAEEYNAHWSALRRAHQDPAFAGHLVRYVTLAATVGTKPVTPA